MNPILNKVLFFGKSNTKQQALTDSVNALLDAQINGWNMAGKNYAALKNVQIKPFNFNHFQVNVQFNPERIVSTAAKTDTKSIEQRRCFLCPAHLPDEQKGIVWGNFLILVNPFPIFPKHLTIPTLEHTPQRISGNLDAMLELSRELPDFHLFYNGAKCGASAPDHMHFQAGSKGFMPIEKEYPELIARHSEVIFQDENRKVYAVRNYLRKFISIEAGDKEQIENVFQQIYSLLENKAAPGDEPMLNLLCQYQENRWIIIVFPRDQHRPAQYFEEGDGNILLSPASVDFGGCCITPLRKDFEKITQNDLTNIFNQVSINDEDFNHLITQLKSNQEK